MLMVRREGASERLLASFFCVPLFISHCCDFLRLFDGVSRRIYPTLILHLSSVAVGGK